MVNHYMPIPQCLFCCKEMLIDDIDYNFDGCQDEYWLCPNCNSSLFRKVRYRKVLFSSYRWDRGDEE